MSKALMNNCLADALLHRSREECLFVTTRRSLTVGEILDLVTAWRTQCRDLQGKRVRVTGKSNEDLVLALLFLDGFASSIILGEGPSDSLIHACDGALVSGDLVLRWNVPNDTSEGNLESDQVSTSWMVPTSGTLGTPKCIAHDFGSLSASTKTSDKKGHDLVWGLVYEVHRFAGLQVLFQAVLGGSCLAIPNQLKDLEAVTAHFKGAEVNALSATPSTWRRLSMGGALDDLALRVATLGGEPADDQILAELQSRFPKAKLTHIYASTEWGVGFSVSDGQAGFPASYLCEGAPNGMQMRISEKGHLEMRKAPSNPWADTGDLVESKEDRVLFRGRADGMINVGGVKVSPESVERVILAIPGVAMAMAVPRASSMIGQVIEALVVPQISDDQEFGDLHETVIAACHRHLEPAEVPAIVRLVKELPMTGAGKVDRRSPRQSSAKEA